MATLKTFSHRSVSLTAPQLHALATAAARDDGALVLPARLKGKAAQSLVGALIEKGVVRETRAKPGMPGCRHNAETDRSYALVITKLGRSSIPASQDGATSPVPAAKPEPKAAETLSKAPSEGPELIDSAGSAPPATKENAPETNTAVTEAGRPAKANNPASSNAPRSGSKLGEVIALLSRETGASVEELIASTGWLPHTIRAALTGLRKRGYAILREGKDGKGLVYRIGPVSCAGA